MTVKLATPTPGDRPYSDEEWQMRVDLAACYRLADRFGYSDIVWNHITARVPGADNHFLISRFGLRFDEITASNLVTLDQSGNVIDGPDDINVTGYIIHRGIYTARHDIACVMHTHTPYGLAVSALEGGLQPVIQDAMMFYNRIAYHDYRGLSTDVSESEQLATELGSNNAMILRNHGLLTAGAAVGNAFIRMYYLERACRAQIESFGTGQAVRIPAADVCEHAAQQFKHFPPGKYEWPALIRLLDEQDPSYKT